jgi:hypothetical protein
MNVSASGRVFASHYLMLTDNPERCIPDIENWSESSAQQGFAGSAPCRLIATEAERTTVVLPKPQATPSMPTTAP